MSAIAVGAATVKTPCPCSSALPPQFVSSLLSAQVNDKAVIALCGIGKMFVGDLVEMGEWGGPCQMS